MSYTPPLKAEVTGFKTTTPLASGATYDSGVLDAGGYTQVQTEVSASHDGTINISFCSDSGCTDVVRSLTIPYVASNGYQFFSAPAFVNFIKYEFTNDAAVTQTDFYYTTKFLTTSLSPQLLTTEAFISPAMVTDLGRNIQVGQDPVGTFTNTKVDGVGFQTTDNLASGATFNSDVLDAQGYTQVQTHFVSDQNGTLGFKFCSTPTCSGTTVGQNGVERYLSVPYLASSGFQLYSAPAFTPYVQYSFQNTSTSTTTQLFYETKLLTKALSGQLLRMDGFIAQSMVANLGRNVIVGQNDAGLFNNVKTDTNSNLNVSISNPRTAFGEIRTAELTPQVQVNFVYGINDDIVNTEISGGTVTSTDSLAVLEITGGSNSHVYLETRQPIKYAPGQGSVGRFTCVFTSGTTGSTQWIGPLDNEDGFAFGFSGDTFGVLRRQNSVDYFTPQTEWNIDVMDGSAGSSNPSAMLIDPTKGNVFEIKYQYLGFGAITYSIEDSNPNGEFVPVHVDRYANTSTTPSVFSPTLPISVRAENTTNTSNIILKSASLGGFVEGKRVLTGPSRSFNNAKNSSTPHTFSIRNAETFNGKTNKVRVYLQFLSAIADGNASVILDVVRNATLSAPTWTGVTNSPLETDVSDSTITGGNPIFSIGLGKVDSNVVQANDPFEYEVNPGDIITFQTNGTNNAGWTVGVSWREDI